MHDSAYLQDLVIILGFAVIIVILFHRLKQPSVAGFDDVLGGALDYKIGVRGFAKS